MQPLLDIWRFTRERLEQAYKDLGANQLTWRPHAAAHCVGEILYHLAGAEHYWAARMSERDPRATEWEDKLDRATTDSFLKDQPCPFTSEEMKPALIGQALEFTFFEVLPMFERPTQKELEMPLISPIGDHVTGYQGLVRLAQHAGYHTGQIWMIRSDPNFPKS